jgi:hypothetical protein
MADVVIHLELLTHLHVDSWLLRKWLDWRKNTVHGQECCICLFLLRASVACGQAGG